MQNLKPFPDSFFTLELKKELADSEFAKVKEGSLPENQDDRWIIYYDLPWLYFHRSWTRNCIYKIHITNEKASCFIDKVLINGDKNQYKYEESKELDQFLEIFDLFVNSKIR